MLQALEQAARAAIDLAVQAGAQDVWTWASRERRVSFTYRDACLEEARESTSRVLEIRLFHEGRYAVHTTTDLRPERLRRFVAASVALTKLLEADADRRITDPALFAALPAGDLELVDAAIDARTAAAREEWCAAATAPAKEHRRLVSVTAFAEEGHALGASVSSNGFLGHWDRTSIWGGCAVTLRDEGDRRAQSGHWAGGPRLVDLPAAAEIGELALSRTAARLGEVKGPTARLPVVVENRAASHLLQQLLGSATARRVHRKESLYEGKLGQRLFSELLTVIDDPLVPHGLLSRHFDAEGIAARSLPIIDGGVLANLYVDTYYGRKLHLDPTTGSPSNRVVGAGSKPTAALIADVGNGLLVTEWLGGNSDGTTGDFSLGCKGHLITGGEVGAPVTGMNLAGNFLSLFSRLVALGNDPWPYTSIRSPTLVFDDIQLSGA
ncbi:MAG: TldD/PmbA family protein [Candidatus Schekmanbacteria bacterium]|nr:TldD/PmbA family protein [Candidatus Schekmanbacteria bacterium]